MALSSLQTTTISTCPVDIDTLIDFIGTFSADEDNLIQSFGDSATSMIETYCGDYIIQRPISWIYQKSTYEITDSYFGSWLNGPQSSGFVTLSAFGKFFELPTKATSITDVSVLVGGDQLVALPSDEYTYDILGNTARLRLGFNEYMTELFQGVTAVKVDYIGGMYPSADAIPADLKMTIMILAKRLYEDRTGKFGDPISSGIKSRLANYRRIGIGR